MLTVDIVSRIVHITTAILLLGGSAFMLLIVHPTLVDQSVELRGTLAAAIRQRWKRILHPGIVLFLVSGFYNYFRAMPKHRGDGLYHGLIGTKILLALAIFFVASALVGRSTKLEFMRSDSKWWLTIVVLLGLLIVAISGYIKVNG